MHKTPLLLGLLTLVACGRNTEPEFAPEVNTETPASEQPAQPSYAMRINGSVTDNVGPQARIAGPGTLEATHRVQAVTLAGSVVASADVVDGVYELGLETVPADALLYIQALGAADELVGAVVVELTDAAVLAATPLDVESSVEAAVLERLLAESVHIAVWAEVRHRVDTALARTVLAEANPDLALANSAVAVQASWEAHVSAWEAAGVSLDAVAAAHLEAATALSAALAAGDPTGIDAFELAVQEAARAEGFSAAAALEADAIASASLRSAILAVEASNAVSLEAIRATTLTESVMVKSAVEAQTAAMIVSPETVTTIETSFDDLRAAIEAATSVEEVEAAVSAWRDTVMTAIEGEITAGMDLFDQIVALFTDALAQLETALAQLEAAIDGVIAAATGIVDAATLASEVATAYADQAATVAADLEDLEAPEAEALSTVQLSFVGL